MSRQAAPLALLAGTRLRSSLFTGSAARDVSILVAALLAGIAAAVSPVGVFVGVLGLFAVLAFREPGRLFAFVLIGAIVLTYGFANVGFRLDEIPVPLADLLLLGLVPYSLL